MSSALTIYVGPYASYTVALRQSEVDNCPQPGSCPNNVGQYCSLCGMSSRYRHRQELVPETKVLFFEPPFDDALYSPISFDNGETRRYLVVPNRRLPGVSRVGPGSGEGAEEIDAGTIAREVQAFLDAFAQELEHLRGLVGDVQIHWGFVHYYC